MCVSPRVLEFPWETPETVGFFLVHRFLVESVYVYVWDHYSNSGKSIASSRSHGATRHSVSDTNPLAFHPGRWKTSTVNLSGLTRECGNLYASWTLPVHDRYHLQYRYISRWAFTDQTTREMRSLGPYVFRSDYSFVQIDFNGM